MRSNINQLSNTRLSEVLELKSRLVYLLESVTKLCGLTHEQMTGVSRNRNIVYARTSFCRLARDVTPQPTYDLIGYFLNRDHSYVIYMVRQSDDVREKHNHYLDLKNKLSHEEIIYHI